MPTGRDRAKEAEMAAAITPWETARSGRAMRFLTGIGAFLLVILLALVAVDLMDREPGGLTRAALDSLDESGVENPVTAVLLNYRSMDTWLELGVLVLAVMAMFALQRCSSLDQVPRIERGGYVLMRMSSVFVPLMILGAGYLLWRGTHAPGGAFQAGALLGAAGVMLRLTARDAFRAVSGRTLRGLIVLSFACFALTGLGFMVMNRRYLEYPPARADEWIFLIELLATLSIGAALWVLFVGAHPTTWSREKQPRTD